MPRERSGAAASRVQQQLSPRRPAPQVPYVRAWGWQKALVRRRLAALDAAARAGADAAPPLPLPPQGPPSGGPLMARSASDLASPAARALAAAAEAQLGGTCEVEHVCCGVRCCADARAGQGPCAVHLAPRH